MEKHKQDPPRSAGPLQEKGKSIIPSEQSGNAIDAQLKTDRTDGCFPVVGIGASAGGLAAFEAFFSGMPEDAEPGMAFVLVQHLAPDHKSILTDLIRRYTRMRVYEAEDGMEVKINCAYIIPPNRDMAFLNGTLQLLEPAAPRGQRLPIDFFFRSLAHDQRERAIGVVLSGTGSDGTLGVRAIKGEGGIVMVQNPASTEYDGMPRSAIGTGLVDYELLPAEMPAQLIAYVIHAFGKPPRPTLMAPRSENALKKIFVLLRVQTGHDFSQYKPSTIQRRIERRMAVHQIETMDDYVKFVQQMPEEVDALFRDMLIGVTNFFRDPDAFAALEEQVIPKLFAGKRTDAAIRVWVPGCSTGEEAYSLAILLAERQDALKQSFMVQVFATDIDSRAITTARAGIYPAAIAADLTPERLARFFSPEPGDSALRINKSIRDMLVFSEQNVIKDPPFSRLDLISCRNLLIYLDGELQKKLIPLFHYALNPGGFLFLGTSETVGEYQDIFSTLDRKLKLYQRKEYLLSTNRAGLGRFLPPMILPDTGHQRTGEKVGYPGKLPLRELAEQALLQQIVQAGALVNAQGDILYLHGRTGMYLEPAPGASGSNNILKMAREGLRCDLTTALHKAAGISQTVCCFGLRVKTNGDFTTVNLIVRPVAVTTSALPEPSLYLVILEQAPEPVISNRFSVAVGKDSKRSSEPDSIDADACVAELKRELQAKEEYLQTANEELETSNEELKSSNEEMQSVNEELQSTNEELETSKEELQSVNEELATVNAELQTKVADLSRVNNDMNNLLAGTGIATVFVDHRLRILRFTPAATKIINLIQSDIGRPVGHIVTNLTGYEHLTADAQDVLDTLIPKELDVQSAEGRWYTMRIQPYRTMDNVIEGAVFTFVDVTATRKLQKQLQKSEELLNASQRLSMAGGWEWNVETQCMYCTEETYRIHDFVPGEMDPGSAEHINRSTECYEPDDRPVIMAAFQRCSEDGQPYDLELPFTTAKGRRIWIRTTARPVIESGKVIRVIGNIMDITERKLAEESLRSSELKFRMLVESSSLGIWKTDAAGRNIYVSPRCCEIAGISEANADGQSWMSNLHPDDRIQVRIGWAAAITAAMPYADEFRFVHPDGRLVWVLCQASPFMVEGHPVEWIGTITDITARIEAEEARREIEQKYRTLHELSPDAYIVGEITVDGRDLGFVDCNQAALDMLGITRDQLLAADVASLSPERQPDGRLSREKAGEMISRCMVKGSLRFDWLHVRAGGEPFPVEITMIIYRERGKIFQHSVWRDLTGFTRPEPPKEHPVATHQEEKRP